MDNAVAGWWIPGVMSTAKDGDSAGESVADRVRSGVGSRTARRGRQP